MSTKVKHRLSDTAAPGAGSLQEEDALAFPLCDLPLDLLEHTGLFLSSSEAVPLLTVSRNFHDLFARSVWRVIGYKVLFYAEPTRSAAFANYGQYVRKIDLLASPSMPIKGLDWPQVFPNTSMFTFTIRRKMTLQQKQDYLNAIAEFQGLYSLVVSMETDLYRDVDDGVNTEKSLLDLAALANTLVSRNMASDKQRLQYLKVIQPVVPFHIRLVTSLIDFVHTVSTIKNLVLHLDLAGCDRARHLTTEEIATLRPHIVELPKTICWSGGDVCKASWNRQLYSLTAESIAAGATDYVIFPHLVSVKLMICCALATANDYTDWTPERFPSLQRLEFKEYNCGIKNATPGRTAAIQIIIAQKWPRLLTLMLNSALTAIGFNQMMDSNPQLQVLQVGINGSALDKNGRFDLVPVLECLPKLREFALRAPSNTKVENDWMHLTNHSLEVFKLYPPSKL
ncbi:hypothetical protein GQ42DRAFT_154144 [Ramicandelaber brevisporus]|nr:hypothetical protein GQ42DRAFT_154144 [Ramicandelaber brevisporus]